MSMNAPIILQTKNLIKSFGDHLVLKGVSFSLRKGETLGLLGGSGSGKSVILRTIIGLEEADQGDVIYRSMKINQLTERELSKIRLQISYSFQSGALFDSLTVFDNLAYPLYEHTHLSYQEIQKRVAEILKLVDLEGKENVMPADLSGGMQKRVGLARAMIMNPEIILYDEPTAGLDPVNTDNVVSIMKKLKENGHAGIFVTHDIPAALQICDRIIILIQGELIFEGTPEQFLKSEDPIVKKFLHH